MDTEYLKRDKAGVSVTWKWLAVTCITVLIATFGYDRVAIDQRFSSTEESVKHLQEKIDVSPTKDDIHDLRLAIDHLSDRIDKMHDSGSSTSYKSPRAMGE